MPNARELAVFRTLAYFAYFHYPLTSFEVWKWLLAPEEKFSLAEVIHTLRTSPWLAERVTEENGFYGLGNVKEDWEDRRARLADALRKYRKLQVVMKVLARVPYVDGIAVCNSLAFHHTQASSDIDLFIIPKEGRTWSARFFTTLPLLLFKQRPGERKRDPVCLSFFAAPSAWNFEKLKIGSEDPYLAYWCKTLIPLLDRSGWVQKFFEKNAWTSEVLPNAQPVMRAPRYRFRERRAFPRGVLSEVLAKKMQEERFPHTIRELKNKDTRVIIRDDMLKFHEGDRREEILLSLKAKMENV